MMYYYDLRIKHCPEAKPYRDIYGCWRWLCSHEVKDGTKEEKDEMRRRRELLAQIRMKDIEHLSEDDLVEIIDIIVCGTAVKG